MSTTTKPSIAEAINELESLQSEHDLNREEALQLLLVTEIRNLRDLLEDIEVHTNNAVRKL